MKPILAVFFLTVSMLISWGCAHTAVKGGSDQQEPAVEAQSRTDSPAEQSKGGLPADAGPESTGAVDRREDTEGIAKGGAAPSEDGEAVLNIDEEKEAESIFSVIEKLEDCYRTKNFDRWLSLLTPEYRTHFSDPSILASEGWDAASIREFFNLLVSARRKGNIGELEISRVEFVSDYKAYVYVILGGEEFPTPQHTFIRIGDSWYKGLSDEGV